VRLIDITPAVSTALEGWPVDTRFETAARWSQARGDSCTVKLLGTDAPSVNAEDTRTLAAHHALDQGGVAILEGLVLAGGPAGEYELFALPVKWRDADAAPVRAVLRIPD